MATVSVRTTLHTTDFEKAMSAHLDESNPPDPLARRQIEDLVVQWDEEEVDCPCMFSDEPAFRDDPSSVADKAEPESETRHIRGKLTLMGNYLYVVFGAECCWTWRKCHKQKEAPSHAGDGNIRSDGQTIGRVDVSLHFSLTAEASITPLTQLKRFRKEKQKQKQVKHEESHGVDAEDGAEAPDGGVKRKEQRALAKVRSGMLERLKADPYVRPLLDSSSGRANKKAKGASGKTRVEDEEEGASPNILCEALIHQSFTTGGLILDTEERVDVSEGTLEGVRRSIFSQSEENLSVIELLLALPFLPRTVEYGSSLDDAVARHGDGVEKKPTRLSCQIGHRAFLRLLEDAMFDACEKEGEDELIDDLNISNQDSITSDCEDDEAGRKTKRTKWQ